MGGNSKGETQEQERLIFTGELGLVQGLWTCRVCVCGVRAEASSQ